MRPLSLAGPICVPCVKLCVYHLACVAINVQMTQLFCSSDIADRATTHSTTLQNSAPFSPSAICKPGLERVRKACKCSERSKRRTGADHVPGGYSPQTVGRRPAVGCNKHCYQPHDGRTLFARYNPLVQGLDWTRRLGCFTMESQSVRPPLLSPSSAFSP